MLKLGTLHRKGKGHEDHAECACVFTAGRYWWGQHTDLVSGREKTLQTSGKPAENRSKLQDRRHQLGKHRLLWRLRVER